MPKTSAESMRELRQRRRDAGLVEFRAWVKPEQKRELEKLLNRLNLQPLEKS